MHVFSFILWTKSSMTYSFLYQVVYRWVMVGQKFFVSWLFTPVESLFNCISQYICWHTKRQACLFYYPDLSSIVSRGGCVAIFGLCVVFLFLDKWFGEWGIPMIKFGYYGSEVCVPSMSSFWTFILLHVNDIIAESLDNTSTNAGIIIQSALKLCCSSIKIK